jgi:4-hydroxy-tetrahydrodipicolinate synthase
MSVSPLRGIFAPVLTAFQPDLELDIKSTIAHYQRLLQNGCDGLAVFGTTSEANSCSIAERSYLLEQLLSAGIDPKKLIVGTGCCSFKDTAELTLQATKAGCAGVLMLPPFYYKSVSNEGLFQYFSKVIETVNDNRLRVYIYHIPPYSMIPIPLDVVAKLLERFPQIVAGVKDSSGDWKSIQQFLQLTEKGFQVFTGSETYLLSTLQEGGAGTISAAANVIAGTLQALYQQWNKPGAEQKQAAINQIHKALRTKPLIPSLKSIVAKTTQRTEWKQCRPPFLALNPEEENQLFANLEYAGFSWP